jgi:photosystem II protein PsbQ
MAVASTPASTSQGWLHRLGMLAMALMLSLSLVACSGEQGRKAPAISPEAMAMIAHQAEGFLAAKDRLPELADLVNDRNWVFTRNLIHGPMQEVGREMLYINQRLLPADRAEAAKRANRLKSSLAELDEAARLQDGESLRKGYIKVASGFGSYAEVIPPQALDLMASNKAAASRPAEQPSAAVPATMAPA